jgi:crotonobetainyl-CoA:carnitine CoA-transferase CaiB-like acyl-CoA transferase
MPMHQELPYRNVKILDLSRNVAGPFGTMILADLGADVIKVEEPEAGDDTRRLAPFWGEESISFLSFNRNKRSVGLDIKSPAGREAVLRLGEWADIVVESFRPGVTERLGLDFSAFAARNPRLIYCSVSAFGTGQLGESLPGYDPLLQAFAGIMKATGHPGSAPVRVAPSIVDLSTGMWTAMRLMASLAGRRDGGGAQHVEVTLVDSAFNLMCHQILGVLVTGDAPAPQGSGSPLTAPYEVFRVADGELMVAAGNDALFQRLCQHLGRLDLLADARFCDVVSRVKHREALHGEIEHTLLTGSADSWLSHLGEAGVPVGPVQDLKTAMAHPIFSERRLLVEPRERPDIPGLRLLRLPIGDPGTSMQAPARLGQHTTEVLREIGLTDTEIEAAKSARHETGK